MPHMRNTQFNFRAYVFHADGEASSRPWCTQDQCNHWIDLMIQKYGLDIVGSDIIPNT